MQRLHCFHCLHWLHCPFHPTSWTVNILDGLAVNRRAPLTAEPAELTSRAIKATKATNIAGGSKRVKKIPSQTPRKMQSIAKRPLPSRSTNERTKTHPIRSIRSTPKFASKNTQRLPPPDGGIHTSEFFALKNIRRQ